MKNIELHVVEKTLNVQWLRCQIYLLLLPTANHSLDYFSLEEKPQASLK